MQIYIAHSSKYDFKNELYKPLQASELNDKYDFIYLYDETDSPGSTKEMIRNCDVVLAEASLPSTGMGIELGWADAYEKPIIFIHRPNEMATSFLNVLSDMIYEYSNGIELVKAVTQGLEEL